jgi:uncharacterized damage-inducible protein DinB
MAARLKQQKMGTSEAVRQFITGNDFEPPARMIADLTSEQAVEVLPGCPYSIADQVAHMLFWQQRWLGRIDNKPLERQKGKNGDWPRVAAEQWESVRSEFLQGLETAVAKSKDPEELARTLGNGDTVDSLIIMIVEHNTYHLGQIALLRQLMKLWPPAGGTDEW